MSTDTLLEAPVVSAPQEIESSFDSPRSEAPPAAITPDVPKRTAHEEMIKAEKKAEKKRLKKEKEKRKGATRILAGTFPMVALIDEQVRTSIPADLVAKVKGAKSKRDIISSTYPYAKVMKKDDYLEEIELLQIELVKMQAWVKESGERIVMLFEGRDAAGKGGTIQRFTENLNPRGAKVVALAKPSDTERGQWYFQRYIENLPTKGEIVFFDRSWYNRGGVEHVMGFCTPHDYLEFMRQAPEFERMMVRSGIRLFKFWFSVSREEQLRRFLSRAQDPLKQWKLSPNGCRIARPLGFLHESQGSHVLLHRHGRRALDRHPLRRQGSRTPSRHETRAVCHSVCRKRR
jgi:polyphosphate kinase 2